MLFRQGFDLYLQGIRVEGPLCNETKVELYPELRMLCESPSADQTSVAYYRKYLDSCGDINRPAKPFISYDAYAKLYADAFEKDVRRVLVRRLDANEIHCNKFNIPDRYIGMTFDSMEDIPEQRQIVSTAKNWVKGGYPECLVLGSHTPGVGKTSTLVSLTMQWFIDNDYREIKRFPDEVKFLNNSIIFLKERQLIDLANHPQIYKGVLTERLSTVPFLAYDDLMSVANKDFVKTVLFDIFDNRIDGNGLPTAITTRFPEERLKREYPDIHSRFTRGTIYYTNSKLDLRNRK